MKARIRTLIIAALVGLSTSGCAGGVTGFIVQQRNHQGDLALAAGNVKEAQLAYQLALVVDPQEPHARSGYAQAELLLAQVDYQHSDFDDAVKALAIAAKYDPDSVRLAELKAEIESARVNREIVVSNYPTYKETGLALSKAYAQLHVESNNIVLALQRFDYTYDSNELRKAIAGSTILNTEVSKLTTRLSNYRQVVESGSPEKSEKPLAPAASLLPLP